MKHLGKLVWLLAVLMFACSERRPASQNLQSDIPAPPIYTVCEITDHHIDKIVHLKGVLTHSGGVYLLTSLFKCDEITSEILVTSFRSCGRTDYLADLEQSNREAHVAITALVKPAQSSRYKYQIEDVCLEEIKIL